MQFRALCLCFALFLCSFGFSQTIVDYFIQVPDSSLLGLSASIRKEIIQNALKSNSLKDSSRTLEGNQMHLKFEVLDTKNGFLRIIGAFEGNIQMCYWKLKNRNTLIVIYQEGCGPTCVVDRFDFYEFDGKSFKPIDNQDLFPDFEADFLGKDSLLKRKSMEANQVYANCLFELPRKGKNILVKWGNFEDQAVYKPYGIGDRLELLWNNGHFKRGKMYWEKVSE